MAAAAPTADVVPFAGEARVAVRCCRRSLVASLRNIVPPLVVLAILLGVWQVLCSSPDASPAAAARRCGRKAMT